MKEVVSFQLNGKPVTLEVDPDRMLLWVLRSELGLTGTKYGCGEGYCGACTVIVDGEAVRSCQTAVSEVAAKSVLTIEGLAVEGRLHPLQETFIRHNVMQCGYCTSGMIMTAYGILAKKPLPSREDIVQGMDDNLCRCGGYVRIIQAVEAAAEAIRKGGRR
jgi:aerobic-type carbon monoxide dehydrogenase small subunit (CoxS/CutS family)